MRVSAKFNVTEVNARQTTFNGEKCVGGEVKLAALYQDKDGNYAEYNKDWAAATPSGSMEMWIDNPDAFAQFVPGAVVNITMEVEQ